MESRTQNQINSLNSYSLKGSNVEVAYTQNQYLYLINNDNNTQRIILHIYNTKSEKEDEVILDTPRSLENISCIAPIPNGEIFCSAGSYLACGAFIVDKNFKTQLLSSKSPCSYSSAAYFDRNIYCFGGFDYMGNYLTLSLRIDLDTNRWIKLTPMPKVDSVSSSIVFNRNILISGYVNKNLFLYSIDIDSFSILPYEFHGYALKILVHAEEKLLLIVRGELIYESEVGDVYTWKQIANTLACAYSQVYYSYNKGWINIGILQYPHKRYFKFNLDEKLLCFVKEVKIKR